MKFVASELNLIQKHLDPNGTKWLEYDSLLSHIMGIPQKKFTPQPLNKLATLVDEKGWMASHFKDAIAKRGSQVEVKMDLALLTKQLMALSSTTGLKVPFSFSEPEAKMVFSYITKSDRIASGATVLVSDVVEAVMQALKALCVERMQSSLTRAKVPLLDLMKKRCKG